MSLRKRIASLEKKLMLQGVVITLDDGTRCKIPGGRNLLRLTCMAMRAKYAAREGSPVALSPALDVIRRTVAVEGDGHMVDLIQAILGGTRHADSLSAEQHTEHDEKW